MAKLINFARQHGKMILKKGKTAVLELHLRIIGLLPIIFPSSEKQKIPGLSRVGEKIGKRAFAVLPLHGFLQYYTIGGIFGCKGSTLILHAEHH